MELKNNKQCVYCNVAVPRKDSDRYWNHEGFECCSAWCAGGTYHKDGRDIPYYAKGEQTTLTQESQS